MRGAKRGSYVGGIVLLVVSGCTAPDSLNLQLFQTPSTGRERLVAGSLETVAPSTQASLRQLGLAVIAHEEAGAVRLSCTTGANHRFDLVLTRVRDGQGEQTRIRMEGKGTDDEDVGFQILGQLEARHREQATGAQK
jgi:hypothetical protein